MEEAELVKGRLQAITVSLGRVVSHYGGCLDERHVASCACLPVLLSGKTELSAFVDSSLFLLTLVTPCDTGTSEPEIQGDASGF